MNHRIYLSVLVFVAFISNVRTVTTTNKLTKKEKNASSSSSSSSSSPSTTMSVLVFQSARGCAIRKNTTTSGITSYRLSGTVGGNETIVFSDRPVRMAKKTSTQSFVDNFDAMFVSSKPNTVISFAEEADDPLIVVITEARIVTTNDNEEDGRLFFEYDIEQQGSQDGVSSIDQFVGNDRQHCSIFVDDVHAEYDPRTDLCFKDLDNSDKYCWYPFDKYPDGSPMPIGNWDEEIVDHGNNNCGLLCTKFEAGPLIILGQVNF